MGTSANAESDGSVLYDVLVLVANPGGLSEGMHTETTIQTSKGAISAASESTLKYHVDDSIRVKVGGYFEPTAGDQRGHGQKPASCWPY